MNNTVNGLVVRSKKTDKEKYLAQAEIILKERMSLEKQGSSLEEKVHLPLHEFEVLIGAGAEEIRGGSFWTEHHGKVYEYTLRYKGQTFTTTVGALYIFRV